MPDPGYLGLIRWGAGAGCPCAAVSGAWRVVQAYKVHQGWPYYQEDGALNACLTLSPYGPEMASYGSTRSMDRWTGLSTGAPLLTPSGDFDWLPAGARAIDIISGAGGSLLLTDPYTLATLQADCATILDHPSAHPIGLAERTVHAARVAETATSAQVTAPFNVAGYTDAWAPARHFLGQDQCVPYIPALVPAPVDGRIVVASAHDPRFGASNTVFDLRTAYRRSDHCRRERLWVGAQGFFSVTRSIVRATWFGGEEVLAGPSVEYFYNQSGWLVVDSGAIPDAWEPYGATLQIQGTATVRLGVAPPSGTPYTTVSGPGGGAASC